MLCCDRRRVLTLGLFGLVGACGFQPMLRDGGTASAWMGTVALAEAHDPETQAFRERARRRLGDAENGARYRLEYVLSMTEANVAITSTADVTRKFVEATVLWQLVDLDTGENALAGKVVTNGAYDATAGPYATLAAERAERADLARELAERVTSRILAAPRPTGT